MSDGSNTSAKDKEMLYLLFYDLTSEIKGKKLNIEKEDFEENLRLTSFAQIIKYIEDSIKILIKKKVDEYKALQSKENSVKINSNDIQNYENQLRKLEEKERRLTKKVFQNNLQKNSLEYKIGEYMQIEEEYEEMKVKFKYEEGKFMDNERKDNEIFILRSENTNLKKEIEQLSSKNKQFAKMITDNEKQIEKLTQLNQSLKDTIEEKQKELNLFSSINININSTSPINSNTTNGNIYCINCSKKDTINKNNTNNNCSTSLLEEKTIENKEKAFFHQLKPKIPRNKIRFGSDISKRHTRNESLDKSKSNIISSKLFNSLQANYNQSTLNLNYQTNKKKKLKLGNSNSMTNLSHCPVISKKKPPSTGKLNLNEKAIRRLNKVSKKDSGTSYQTIMKELLNI